MARDIKQLHPRLQALVSKLQAECEKQGISIGIGECLRTVKEQDELYAQGRTKAGAIVTNAKGSTYSSMHQWGVAFDFYLKEDVDGDGKSSDDAFNNKTKLFNKVGAIGKKLGLEWGGDWTSPVDLPHFQLPDWGSTATKLKKEYGTPAKFMATWDEKKEEKKATKKSVADIAKEVIAGKWGEGAARKANLKKAGYDYDKVQDEVKKQLKSAEKKVEYYGKYNGSSASIDVVFKAIGVPSKYIKDKKGEKASVRKPVAAANGISTYKGTAAQNNKLINLAKKGKLKKV